MVFVWLFFTHVLLYLRVTISGNTIDCDTKLTFNVVQGKRSIVEEQIKDMAGVCITAVELKEDKECLKDVAEGKYQVVFTSLAVTRARGLMAFCCFSYDLCASHTPDAQAYHMGQRTLASYTMTLLWNELNSFAEPCFKTLPLWQ